MLITFDIGGTSIKYGILTLRKGQPVFVMQEEVSSDARVLKGPGILHRVESLIAKAMRQDIKGIATVSYTHLKLTLYEEENKNMSNDVSLRVKAQRLGGKLSAMVLPNLGAFMGWGILTALGIWLSNDMLKAFISPVLTYLLPLLIAISGGK